MTGESGDIDLRSMLGTVGAFAALNIGVGAGLAIGMLRGDSRLGSDLAESLGFDALLAAAGVRINVIGEQNLWAKRPGCLHHEASEWSGRDDRRRAAAARLQRIG